MAHNGHVVRRYPKSRLPGPAVKMFEFELELEIEEEEQRRAFGVVTVRAPYDDATRRIG